MKKMLLINFFISLVFCILIINYYIIVSHTKEEFYYKKYNELYYKTIGVDYNNIKK